MTPLRYVIFAALVLMIAALAWWYFMLRAETKAIAQDDAARGSIEEAPSFGSRLGSTYENIVSSASSLLNGGKSAPQTLGRLAQISKTPTAGAGFAHRGGATRIRFVERSTGYLLEGDVTNGSLTRLTNTLAPQTYYAVVGEKNVIMQTLEDGRIVTIVGTVSATSSGEALPSVSTKRLPDGIATFAMNPAESEIVYTSAAKDAGIAFVRRDIATGKEKQVFSSPLSGWHIEWLLPDRILIHQNASASATSYVYELKGSALAPLLQGTRGQTVLSHPSSRALLFGDAVNEFALHARVTDQASTITLPVRTVPEKCVWAPSSAKATEGTPASLPAGAVAKTGTDSLIVYCAVPQSVPPQQFLDAWYRGEEHTADSWWRIDVRANTAESLYSPGDLALDVEDPRIDKNGAYITFLNARDKSLWLLRINP